jgi:hypothetical protein
MMGLTKEALQLPALTESVEQLRLAVRKERQRLEARANDAYEAIARHIRESPFGDI